MYSGKPNRLIDEKSPYLLQHAYNPVDWYPWGEEAFAKARAEDKPVLLSVGYSTCHWCHVMEHESFEDEEVAGALNDVFVCIKVDREERPDIDTIYMTVCQAMTGSGGWPLTIIMTPDKRPFYAGTYFPKHNRYGRPGIIDLARGIQESWQEKRDELFQIAEQVTDHLQSMVTASPLSGGLGEEVLTRAYNSLAKAYDGKHGGFGRAPKFPTPHNLSFLLRYWQRTGEAKALEIVSHTLDAMGQGGMFDQVGFGFHRYSTDPEWLLPHFEKMLYDQALLAIAYLDAYQAGKQPSHATKAQEIFTYVLRDMTDEDGGFYSAEDADSEGEEGKFYVWTTEELRRVLTPANAKIAIKVYSALDDGNFYDEATREKTGTNILHLTKPLGQLAQELEMSTDELGRHLTEIRQTLWGVRENRIHPFKDNKILTDWNGLMIAALARGGRVLGQERYTQAAEDAVAFIKNNLLRPDGKLLKRYREGEAALPAYVDDYAFLVWGLIELYETTFKPYYLRLALSLNEILLKLFQDTEHGGLFLTSEDAEELLVRPKEVYDGAIPSGNSVAALNNLRLARLTGQQELEEAGQSIIEAFAGDVAQNPAGHTFMLQAVDYLLGPAQEVLIVGDVGAEDTNQLLRALNAEFLPRKAVLVYPVTQQDDRIAVKALAPFVQGQEQIDGKATAYVCSEFTCQRATTDAGELLERLRNRT